MIVTSNGHVLFSGHGRILIREDLPHRLLHARRAVVDDPPRFTASPNAVPMITAKITAGIFSLRPMELTPIPMEQTPKIFVSSELILVGSLCPNKAPTTPPMATDRDH